MDNAHTEFRFFGPPGCGKTTKLQSSIRATAQARGPDSIVVTSFTKAAAVELAGRNLPIDPSRVSTLHALCYRALDKPPIAEVEAAEWNKDVGNAAYKLTVHAAGKLVEEAPEEAKVTANGDKLLNEYNLARARREPIEELGESVQGFVRAWEAWKQDGGMVDFSDMIGRAVNELDQCPGDPEILYADEAQDLTFLQMSLLRKWARHTERLVLAGDDDQAIFTFAGADPEAFLNPPLPPEDEEVLSQSYRVPQQVQKLAEFLIARVSYRKKKIYKPRDAPGTVTHKHTMNWREPVSVLREVDAQLTAQQHSEYTGPKVMILASCAYMLRPIIKQLRREGYPFHNPFQRSRGEWNPLGARAGVRTSDRLMAFFRDDPAVWGQAARFWTYDDAAMLVGLLKAKGIMHTGGKKRLMEKAKEEPYRSADIDWLLAQVFTQEALTAIFDHDTEWLLQHMLADKKKASAYPLQVLQSKGADGIVRAPEIVVGTIHSVKGAEAHAVILFPDISPNAFIGTQEAGGERARDRLYRQFYVGITRARDTLILGGRAKQGRKRNRGIDFIRGGIG